MIILEPLLRVGNRLESCNDFILAKVCIKVDVLMRLVEILALILAQVREHGAVFHVVSVNHHIIRLFQIAVLLHIGHAIIAVRLVKGVLQIKVGIARCLHDRVIDIRIGDIQPSHRIAMLCGKPSDLFDQFFFGIFGYPVG